MISKIMERQNFKLDQNQGALEMIKKESFIVWSPAVYFVKNFTYQKEKLWQV